MFGFPTTKVVTVEAGLRARGADVTFEAGATPFDRANTTKIKRAVAVARQADVVVMVIGDSSNGDAHGQPSTGGENVDRHALGAPGGQTALLEAVLADPALAERLVLIHIGSRQVDTRTRTHICAQEP